MPDVPNLRPICAKEGEPSRRGLIVFCARPFARHARGFHDAQGASTLPSESRLEPRRAQST
eukprot:4138870-Prymnesium_polylepis.4